MIINIEYFNFFFLIIISSFIKCIVDSSINKEFFYRRSFFDNCKTVLKIQDLIPILSYLKLKGHCRYCNKKIHFSIFIYEISALIIAILYIIFKNKLIFVDYFDWLIILLLIYIAIEDIISYEINEKLQLILLLVEIIKLIINFNMNQLIELLLLIIIYNFLYLILKKGIGYGDIKLYCLLAINLSLLEGINLFLYTFIYAGFMALFLLITKKANRKTRIPLAPYIFLSYITLIIIKELMLW